MIHEALLIRGQSRIANYGHTANVVAGRHPGPGSYEFLADLHVIKSAEIVEPDTLASVVPVVAIDEEHRSIFGH